jgi:Glycosyl transferase family 4 group
VLNTQNVARVALDLKQTGFVLDVMLGHNGWGGDCGMETVAVLLDRSSIDWSQRYVDVDSAILEAMFASAI